MDNFERAQLRAKTHSVSAMKRRTLDARLKGDYNSARLYRHERMNIPFYGIVNTSTFVYNLEAQIIDYKRISIPKREKIQLGDVLYWEQEKKNYIVYFRRDTEKDYFLGYMTEANYNIEWRDENGKEYSQIASFIQLTRESIKLADEYEYLNSKRQILMKATPEALKLDYYQKFIIAGKTWRVMGKSTMLFPGMVVLFVMETEFNKDTDTNIPYGQIDIIKKVSSSLDDIVSIELDKIVILSMASYVNGTLIDDEYSIKTKNCRYDSSTKTITFDKKGTAIITVESLKTGEIMMYKVEVEEEVSDITYYTILGSNNIKTLLSGKFQLVKNVNGTNEPATGTWSISSDDLVTITSIEDNTCTLRANASVGKFTLSCEVEDQILEKEIEVISIY